MLNDKQKEVVKNNNNSLVNIAGPGSGKTHTLIAKIEDIVSKESESILGNILVLTFTNAAANEIKERALKNFKTNRSDLYFGTYHSVFKRILEDEMMFYELDLGLSPTISTPNETLRSMNNRIKNYFIEEYGELVENLMEKLKENKSKKDLTISMTKKNLVDGSSILKIIDNIINHITKEDIKEVTDTTTLYKELNKIITKKIMKEIDFDYSDEQRSTNTFGKFLICLLKDKVLSEKDLEKIINKLVTSYFEEKIQQEIITFSDIMLMTLMTLDKNEDFRKEVQDKFKYIFIDEFQDTNIIQNEILKLLHNKTNICVIGDPYQSIYGFLGANISNILNAKDEYNARTIQLEENYRSNQNIVELTNYLGLNMIEKVLGWKPCKSSSGNKNNKIKIFNNMSEPSQREYLVKKINKIPKEETIGIINRSGNDYLTESKLTKHRIEFNKLGGLSLRESVEVQSFISLYTYVLDKNKVNALSYFLTRIEGIGAKGADIFINKLKNKKEVKNKKITKVLDELEEIRIPILEINSNQVVKEISKQIKEYHYKYILPKISKPWKETRIEEAKTKIDILHEEILEKGHIFEVKELLDSYFLGGETKTDKEDKSKNVVVTTIHSAKGLEWDHVFLIDWDQNSFERDCKKEAQRLNYVAVSRAKTNLYILSRTSAPFNIGMDYINNNKNIFETMNSVERQEQVGGVISFGKHKGKKIEDLPRNYAWWLYENRFMFLSKRTLTNSDVDLLRNRLNVL